jgi:ribosomal protein L24E
MEEKEKIRRCNTKCKQTIEKKRDPHTHSYTQSRTRVACSQVESSVVQNEGDE